MLAPESIREYDIRGVVPTQIDGLGAYQIGRAFASLFFNELKESKIKVCVSRDGRLSSEELFQYLRYGLEQGGIEVIDIGVGPTPQLYFATKHYHASGGIMVTGSHNPSDHNGFKFVLNGSPFFGANLAHLADIIKKHQWCVDSPISFELHGNPASLRTSDHSYINSTYCQRLLKELQINQEERDSLSRLKIAWDPGNGAAAEILQMLLGNVASCQDPQAKLPGNHFVINDRIDGRFPSHPPDPTNLKNLNQLKELILSNQCDLGIAFDGDGDRIGVMDSTGTVLWGDQLLLFYAQELLAKQPGLTIITDVKVSQIILDQISKHGGIPLMWKTGHSLIKMKMKETGAVMAGEMSGHIFFADRYEGFDDALYAAIRLLRIMAQQKVSLKDFRLSLPKTYNTPEIRIPCKDEDKFTIIQEIKKDLKLKGINFLDIDGIRVNNEDGWALLRASNTQGALVIRCESSTEEGLKKQRDFIDSYLKNYNLS